MIGLDTNILARYILEDNPEQSNRVNALWKKARQLPEPLFISTIVLCELVWVLSTGYAQSKTDVCGAVDILLDSTNFVIEYEDSVREALVSWRAGSAGFGDYLIGARNLAQGCRYTATFDRALRTSNTFSVL